MSVSIKYLVVSIWPLLGFLEIIQAQSINKLSWELVKKEGNIEVFTRENDDIGVNEIRILLSVDCTLEQVKSVLSDVPNYSSWVYKCISSKRLLTVHDNEFYYYIVSDFPFPFTDRDLAVHSKQWMDGGIYYSKSTISPKIKEENEELVHFTEFESLWKITQPLGQPLQIDYQAKSSPGGDIPNWLVNLVITKGPLETMIKFVERIEAITK